MADDRAVVNRASIPLAGDRLRVDRQRLVHRAEPRPTEICHDRTRRDRGYQPTARITELRLLIRTELDGVAVLMNMTMMQTALCRVPGYSV